MANIISGKELSEKVRKDVKQEIEALKAETGQTPGLAVVQVGDNPASSIYVRNKKRACEFCGIRSSGYNLPDTASMDDLLDLIDVLNKDPSVNGILCQLPLPSGMDEDRIIQSIRLDKDVDGFHPANAGRLSAGMDCLVPCTPAGILEMIRSTGIEISGKHCVIVGRSNIVGKPVAQLMLKENATVTITHSRTVDLASVCRQADILIVAIGKAEVIRGSFVKPGAIVIDVGINRMEDGKLKGDVAFDEAAPIVSAISPVPGGVGPMTIAMLMANTLQAFKQQNDLSGK